MLRLRIAASSSRESSDTSLAVEHVLAGVGRSRQPSTFMKVDLPEPDGPITATNSPCAMSTTDAGERAHLGLAHVVDLGEVAACRISGADDQNAGAGASPDGDSARAARLARADDHLVAFLAAAPPRPRSLVPSVRPVRTSTAAGLPSGPGTYTRPRCSAGARAPVSPATIVRVGFCGSA